MKNPCGRAERVLRSRCFLRNKCFSGPQPPAYKWLKKEEKKWYGENGQINPGLKSLDKRSVRLWMLKRDDSSLLSIAEQYFIYDCYIFPTEFVGNAMHISYKLHIFHVKCEVLRLKMCAVKDASNVGLQTYIAYRGSMAIRGLCLRVKMISTWLSHY